MQFFFAAPFLIVAALCFSWLSAFKRTRRYAILVPAGIISAGPAFILGVIVSGLAMRLLLKHDLAKPVDWGIIFVTACITVAIAISVIRTILLNAAALFVRVVVMCGGFCSYMVILLTAWVFIAHLLARYLRDPRLVIVIVLSTAAFCSAIGAWFIARNPETYSIKVTNNA
jgi:hypothetical protein